MRLFLLIFTVLVLALAAWPAARIGVLPVPVARGIQTEFASEELRASLQAAIVADIQGAKLGEAVPLAWPEFMEHEQLPNFETLVGMGREQGCTGVLLVQIRDIRYVVKEQRIPLLGDVKVGEAEVLFSGGLIDVSAAMGVAPVQASGKESQRPMRGPDPGEIAGRPLEDDAFDDSALGKAFDIARGQLVQAVTIGVPRLSTQAVERPARANAPTGVSFAQDVFTFLTPTGYDRRGVIAVVNRGDTPKTFTLWPVAPLPDVTAGFVGAGSIDAACTLGPGQWKYVRFILNSDRTLEDAELQLGLFVAEDGEEPNLKGPPHDTAVMRLTAHPPDARLKLEVIRQDPATLAYTCRLTNSGAPIWGVGVRVSDKQQAHLVRIMPNVSERVFVPERGVVEFTVAPRLWSGMPAADVRLEVTGMPDANPPATTLHFAIPVGKQVYYGLANTSSANGSFAGWCANEGGTHQVDGEGRESCVNLGHSWSDSSFSENMKYLLGRTWAAVTDLCGGPQVPRKQDWRSVTGYRGAIIRPEVLARLPELATQDTLYPSVIFSERFAGIVAFAPSPEGTPTVVFGAYSLVDDPILNLAELNEKGHAAIWPFARFDAGGRAFITWVDAAAGSKSNVALRISTDEVLNDWRPVSYLTTHGLGVDDPVLLVGAAGYLVIAWEDLRDGNGRVYLRVSHNSGESFAPEVALPAQPGELQSWPHLVSLSGGLGVVYVSRLDGIARIQFRALNRDGALVGEPLTLSRPGVACGEPQIAAAHDGSLHVVWREGEGAASEVWHTKIVKQTAQAPQRLTDDNAYSEYPVIDCMEDALSVTYHSDSNSVTDLMYRMTSADGGKSWSAPAALPSAQSAIEHAWLQVTFHLENSREEYPPFSAHFLVNGTEVGVIRDTVLEGIYLFPVPRELVRGAMGRLAGNTIEVKIDDPMQGHFIYSSEQRLIAKWGYTQLPVVAASQQQADRIAKSAGVDRNHTQPDLVLTANAMPKLPAELKAGDKLPLVFQVYNIGETPATNVVFDLYGGEKFDPMEKTKPITTQKLGTIAPGQSVEIKYTFVFDPQRTPRVHAVLRAKEEDFHPADNTWAVSFTLGEAGTLPPTVGTDTPHLFYTPDLLDAVNIPNLSRLSNLVSLPSFIDMLQLPELPVLPQFQVPDLKDFSGKLTNRIKGLTPTIPGWEELLD